MDINRISCILAIAAAPSLCSAAVAGIEYWFDDSFESRTFIPSDGEADMELDLSGLSPGLHRYNLRAIDETGKCGVLYCFSVVYVEKSSDAKLSELEYWFDNDMTSPVTADISSGEASFEIDSPEAIGLHTLTLRAADSEGRHGSSHSQMVIVTPPPLNDNELVAYSHWSNLGKTEKTEIESCRTFGPTDLYIDLSGEFTTMMESGYSLDLETPCLRIAGDLEVGISFEDRYGNSSLPVTEPLGPEFTLPIEFKALGWDETATVDGNSIAQGFILSSAKGDKITWEATNPCKIDVYNQEGNLERQLEMAGSGHSEKTETTVEGNLYAVLYAAGKEGTALTCSVESQSGISGVYNQGGKIIVYPGRIRLKGYKDCRYAISPISGISRSYLTVDAEDLEIPVEPGIYILTLTDPEGNRILTRKTVIK